MEQEQVLTLDEYKHTILSSIDIGISASNEYSNYSIGLRNGMRYCKALIDGNEPQYENTVEEDTALADRKK